MNVFEYYYVALAFRYSAQMCDPCSHPSIMNILYSSFCAYRKYSSISIRCSGRNVHSLVAVAGLSFNSHVKCILVRKHR